MISRSGPQAIFVGFLVLFRLIMFILAYKDPIVTSWEFTKEAMWKIRR